MTQPVTAADAPVWDLADIEDAGPGENQRDADAIRAAARDFGSRYRGRIAELDGAQLARALTELDAVLRPLARRLAVPSVYLAVDSDDSKAMALLQTAQELTASLQPDVLFLIDEWRAVDASRREQLLADPALERWRHLLDTLWRAGEHTLPDREERLLAATAVTGRHAWVRLFTHLLSRLRVHLRGRTVSLEEALALLEQGDRALRHEAADSVTHALGDDLDTRAFIVNTLVLDRASEDRLRGYPHWMAATNAANRISDEAAAAVIDVVSARYDICRRYYRLKARLLGVGRVRFDGDRLAPVGVDVAFIPWEKARCAVLDAYRGFSPAFHAIAADAFDRGWIHACPGPGKMPDGTTMSVPGVHPYVLLSYTGTLRSLLTLSHELGHAVHSVLAEEQPLVYAQLPLPLAEVASLLSEQVVLRRLMAADSRLERRLALLMTLVDSAVNMVFRHVAITRFEESLREACASQDDLRAATISELWLGAHRAMLADSVELPEGFGAWWSCVPHLVAAPGHEYLHAIGYLVANALHRRAVDGGTAAVAPIIELLRAGASDTPERLLRRAGLDLDDPSFWQQQVDAVDALVAEAEALAGERAMRRRQSASASSAGTYRA